jgi:hypothetical protein
MLLTAIVSFADLAAQTTSSQYDDGFDGGRLAGRADVINNPSAYGLVSRTNIPAVRIAVPQNAAFTLNLGGTWTRYGLTGRDKTWTFNTNTGELKGSLGGSSVRALRLIPYYGSQAGPQMTIQLRPTLPAYAPQDAERIVRMLLKAVGNDNYSEFLQQVSASLREAIPKETFSEAVRVFAAEIKSGYDLSFLTSLTPKKLTQKRTGVYVWRVNFKRANNKGLVLVKLIMRDGKVNGLWLDNDIF